MSNFERKNNCGRQTKISFDKMFNCFAEVFKKIIPALSPLVEICQRRRSEVFTTSRTVRKIK